LSAKYFPEEIFHLILIANVILGCSQRTGIADDWEFEIRPPELLPGFLIKINI
jgi:hypothetical protein